MDFECHFGTFVLPLQRERAIYHEHSIDITSFDYAAGVRRASGFVQVGYLYRISST
jgi:hypothetical protein